MRALPSPLAQASALFLLACGAGEAPKAPKPPRPPAAHDAPKVAETAASTTPPPTAPEDGDAEEPLPEGFVRIAEQGDTPCKNLIVKTLAEPGPGMTRFVQVIAPDGKRVYEAHGRRYMIEAQALQMDLWGEFCGD